MMKDGLRKAKLLVIGALGALVLGLFACRNSAPTVQQRRLVSALPARAAGTPAPVLRRAAAFAHNRTEHQQPCSLCHQRDAQEPAAPLPVRPYHNACVVCHAQEKFLSAEQTGPFCASCHPQEVILDAREQLRVAAFPAQLRQFGLTNFSHRDHLDPQQLPADVPAPKCTDCHRFEPRMIAASFPRHPECYRCHIHTAGQALGDCGACHSERGKALPYLRGAGPAIRQFQFRHGSHLRQRSINWDCRKCHQRVALPGSGVIRSDLSRIRTLGMAEHRSACFKCHVDENETECEKCHRNGPP